jgi:hypothetical protein
VLTFYTRVILFYPLSALVILSSNIQANPSHNQSRKDIRLFETALAALDQVSRLRAHWNENKTGYIREFITELERTAKQAVETARRQDDE